MAKKKTRIDTAGPAVPLTSNPFAALRGNLPDLPPGEAAAPAETKPDSAGPADDTPYQVEQTRKGGWPLAIERRAAGKVVTVLSRVSGDTQALLATLKRHCGAGGAVRGGAIEIQGDHRERIEAFLTQRRR